MPYRDPKDPRKLAGVYAWAAANPEKVQAAKAKYAAKNKAAILERGRAWRAANKERSKQFGVKWRSENPHMVAELCRRRQAAKGRRTPAWLTADDRWLMQEAYALARMRSAMLGFKWVVDHIVPLRGKYVSGLHVPNNIQVIPYTINARKGAKEWTIRPYL